MSSKWAIIASNTSRLVHPSATRVMRSASTSVASMGSDADVSTERSSTATPPEFEKERKSYGHLPSFQDGTPTRGVVVKGTVSDHEKRARSEPRALRNLLTRFGQMRPSDARYAYWFGPKRIGLTPKRKSALSVMTLVKPIPSISTVNGLIIWILRNNP